ncbi:MULTISPECIES: hypothetical protein [Burkholderia]|uniref:Uncharacterized protein n=1 Tax=Burkholderia mayonis TaxID=1385591 RepID=A0A1B4FK84_9BURK|nr:MULTISPECIES: hypothetical protein [Burkholderia]AOJ04096.1 hypothetical protein WS70_19625 [Burkholderia mayonis]KVE45593.1 hypothetical protein WS69_03985 [Burkholderia sp. BDU5]KVE46115.1 hypothetical protein WS70_02955 [Burkholderia mayonis]
MDTISGKGCASVGTADFIAMRAWRTEPDENEGAIRKDVEVKPGEEKGKVEGDRAAGADRPIKRLADVACGGAAWKGRRWSERVAG